MKGTNKYKDFLILNVHGSPKRQGYYWCGTLHGLVLPSLGLPFTLPSSNHIGVTGGVRKVQ